jgi:hypothetical protein
LGSQPDLGIFTDLNADYLPIRSAAPSLFDDKPTEIPRATVHFRSPQRDTIRLAQGTIIAPVRLCFAGDAITPFAHTLGGSANDVGDARHTP